MADNNYSDAALALLRLHFSGHSLLMTGSNPESLQGQTLEETRAAYGELVAAGLMISPRIEGRERDARYWLTLAAIEQKAEWLSPTASGRPASPRDGI